MEFTPDQARAIFPPYNRNLIVVAGAGSGKTRVLVQRYLELLAHSDWRLNQLVAITFTQKAAQEMRDRVRQALTERVNQASGPEQTRWADHLAEMNTARIDTIHALCGTILRANAPEAGLDPRFTVLDEVQREMLIDRAIDRTLLDLLDGDTPDPVTHLFTYYEQRDIRQTLTTYCKQPLPPIPDHAGHVLAGWQAQWETLHRPLFLEAQRDPILELDGAWLLANQVSFPTHNDTLVTKLTPILEALAVVMRYQPGDDLIEAWRSVQRISQANLRRSGSKSNWRDAAFLDDTRRAYKAVVEQWARPLAERGVSPPDQVDADAADLMPLWSDLIGRVQHRFERLKAADDLLDFDDLERRTAQLLQDFPHVRQRYVNREFKHVLVDEFQDTNDNQWAIIRALTNPDDPALPARLFVVGDPKQSVYGFRGGDVRVFEAARRELHALPQPDDHLPEVPLATSFRTHAPLMQIFNHVFGQLLQRTPGSLVQAYEVTYGQPMSAHRVTPPTDHPPLEIMLIDERPRDPHTGEYLPDTNCAPINKHNADVTRRWEAHEIATRIHAMVADGRPVYDRDTHSQRPMRYGDVALLFRTLQDANLYEQALQQHGISYVTVGGRGYYDRQEIWDVMALLESLYNPYDDLSLATALRSPLFNLSDEALLSLRTPRYDEQGKPSRGSLWGTLRGAATGEIGLTPADALPTVARAWHILQDLQRIAGRVTIYELIRAALDRTSYLATLTALPDGTRRRANVQKLITQALASDKITLSAFTRHITQLTDREVREQEADTYAGDAVTLMTIHKSKGLEFPVVFLPDTTRRPPPPRQPLVLADADLGAVCLVRDENGNPEKPMLYNWLQTLHHERDLAESKRLFYVAATRAADLLIVSGAACWSVRKAAWSLSGSFRWLLESLGLAAWHGDDHTITLPEGGPSVRVYRPLGPPDRLHAGLSLPQTALWNDDSVRRGHRLDGETAPPPLLRSVPPQPERVAYNLATTQLATLGEIDEDVSAAPDEPDSPARRVRRRVLHTAPDRVRQARVSQKREQRVPKKTLGNIAHEALRWWRLPLSKTDMQSELASYAWKYGVVHPDDTAYAVDVVRNWLRELRYKDIYRKMDNADRIYREIPFIYRTEKRVIHGVVDVLFQQADGTWALVDYKSGQVPGYQERNDGAERENFRLLANHTKRYHLQVGVYAAAVDKYLATLGEATTPDDIAVYIYYLQYGQTQPVAPSDWQAAVDKLETKIGKLIEDTDA